ncbi:MAG: hypothetical protein AAB074_07745 [Planctomycetota bacterium]
MRWNLVLSGVLSLGLSFPAFADPGEEFPEGPKGEEEALPGSDEEEMEEEQIDVLGTLETIVGDMKDAEKSLADINGWKATDAQGNAIDDVKRLIDAQDLQKKAIDDMSRIFEGGKNEQEAAVQGLEKLIKAAKEGD